MPESSADAPQTGVTLVEALGYRSLRHVTQRFKPFQVLVGPNASGKSNLMDVMAFVGDVLRTDLTTAIGGDERLDVPMRAVDGRHLMWMRQGPSFQLAIEMTIPGALRSGQGGRRWSTCRYEIAVDVEDEPRFTSETLLLLPDRNAAAAYARSVELPFGSPPPPPESIVLEPHARAPAGSRRVVSRGADATSVLYSAEVTRWRNPFRIEAGQSALANLPADRERFPVAMWFRERVSDIRRIVLDGEAMRRPSPPMRGREFLPDGSNLPHVIDQLERDHPEQLQRWVKHVREALPDIESIGTRERDEDRHRYLVIHYRSGLEAPSWLVSDGTLRLLALTLLAYLPLLSGTFLIEEPENGVHPAVLETMLESLSSVYGAQVILATHSPLVASQVGIDHLLCLTRSHEGATDIVEGRRHPRLASWQHEVDLGTLLASGVLG